MQQQIGIRVLNRMSRIEQSDGRQARRLLRSAVYAQDLRICTWSVLAYMSQIRTEGDCMERAVRIYKYGPPEVLTIESVEAPQPGPGEALIRHTAIGLNFVEVYFRRGTFRARGFRRCLATRGQASSRRWGPEPAPSPSAIA
jgi:hypothetical protein